jgi:hypothetical protein
VQKNDLPAPKYLQEMEVVLHGPTVFPFASESKFVLETMTLARTPCA